MNSNADQYDKEILAAGVAKLKHLSGPVMVVANVNSSHVAECLWYSINGVLLREYLPTRLLEVVQIQEEK